MNKIRFEDHYWISGISKYYLEQIWKESKQSFLSNLINIYKAGFISLKFEFCLIKISFLTKAKERGRPLYLTAKILESWINLGMLNNLQSDSREIIYYFLFSNLFITFIVNKSMKFAWRQKIWILVNLLTREFPWGRQYIKIYRDMSIICL